MSKSKRLIITINDLQQEALAELMKADLETNMSAYVGRLIIQEKLKREQDKGKRSVGRPKKEDEEELYYPAPYEGGGVYTKNDWEGYYNFRNKPVAPLPPPLTKEELKSRGY